MSDFASAQASGGKHAEVARACVSQLGDTTGHTLGFVYTTSQLNGGFGEIVTVLKRETGVQTWVGTAGLGVAGPGATYFDEPAVTVLTCRIPDTGFRLLQPVRVGHVAKSLPPDPEATVGIVHADPRNRNLADLVATIAHARSTYLVGTLSVGSGIHPQAIGNRIADGGVSGVMLGGPGAPQVTVGLTQDCLPMGEPHAVGRGDGRVVAELDGRPAFDVLREDAGAAKADDPRQWLTNVHPAEPMVGSDFTRYMVRNLVGIDQARGLVGVGATLKPGDPIVFVRRSRAAGERDLSRMLADVKTRAKAPKAAIYFSCVTRGPNIFSSKDYEMQAIRDALGGIPAIGFFGNGEIANDRVHGYSGVLTLFS